MKVNDGSCAIAPYRPLFIPSRKMSGRLRGASGRARSDKGHSRVDRRFSTHPPPPDRHLPFEEGHAGAYLIQPRRSYHRFYLRPMQIALSGLRRSRSPSLGHEKKNERREIKTRSRPRTAAFCPGRETGRSNVDLRNSGIGESRCTVSRTRKPRIEISDRHANESRSDRRADAAPRF